MLSLFSSALATGGLAGLAAGLYLSKYALKRYGSASAHRALAFDPAHRLARLHLPQEHHLLGLDARARFQAIEVNSRRDLPASLIPPVPRD